jgi:hypothetical protein
LAARESISPHFQKKQDSDKALDIGFCVARFIRFYGADLFDNGNIGWKLFWLMFSHIKRLQAMERVELTHAVTIAAGIVMAGDKVAHIAQEDMREAYG